MGNRGDILKERRERNEMAEKVKIRFVFYIKYLLDY